MNRLMKLMCALAAMAHNLLFSTVLMQPWCAALHCKKFTSMAMLFLTTLVCPIITLGDAVSAYEDLALQHFNSVMQLESWKNVPTFASQNDVRRETLRLASRNIPTVDISDSMYSEIIKTDKACLSRLTSSNDSITHIFTTWHLENIRRPVYWIANGYQPTIPNDFETIYDFVMSNIVHSTKNKTIKCIEALATREYSISGMFSGKNYLAMSDEFYIFWIDDQPNANWKHPARCVFIDKKLESFVVLFVNEPVLVHKNGEEISFRFFTKNNEDKENIISTEMIRSSVNSILNESNAVSFSGDTSSSYAILVSGGWDIHNNHTRYWGDMAVVYSALTKKYGIPKSNIKVCMSDGTSSNADLSSGSSGYYYNDYGVKCYFSENSHTSFTSNSSPLDLDGDGEADVEYDARKETVQTVFANMKNSLTANDQLFVFVTDHGGQNDDTGLCYLCLWNKQQMTPTEFAAMTKNIKCPIAFAMEFCYSGAFIPELKAQSNRVIATAAGVETSSGFMTKPELYYMNPWVYYFVAAIRGTVPSLSISPWNSGSSASVIADKNGDSLVSIKEASDYARNSILNFSLTSGGVSYKYSETPKYESSPSDLGDNFFILKQAASVDPRWSFSLTDSTVGADGGCILKKTFGADGGTYDVSITCDSSYMGSDVKFLPSTSISGSWPDWFRDEILFTSSSNVAKWRLKVDPNPSTSARYDYVTVSYKELSQRVLIYQEGQSQSATTYTVTYKPGSYASGSTYTATKTNNVTLALRNATYSRTGYTQTAWSTNSNGTSRNYELGANYTANAPLTLYPYWTTNTYTVSYSLNGGTHGTTHPSSATYDTAFKVSAPSRSGGYTFAGWTVTSGLNTSTAKYGTTSSSQTTSITSSSQKCLNGATGDVWFKNLRSTSGSVTLTANWVPVSSRPENDNFANATRISGATGSTSGSNVGATYETGEPLKNYKSAATNTIWWVWTAPSSGTATFSTTNTTFDTVMGVYTGTSVSSLTTIKQDDDGGPNNTSICTFDAVSGTTYYIAVSGYGAANQGTIKLYWSMATSPITYSIIYALNSGTAGTSAPTSATYDMAFKVSAPSRSGGYTFAGWTVTSGLNTSTAKYGTTSSSQTTSITSTSQKCSNGATGDVWFKNLRSTSGSVTLTANWTPVSSTYTVTYKPGANGTGSQQTVTKTQNVALTLKDAIFTRTGYTQTGWSTSDGGSKAYNLGASYTDNAAITLYPYWTANTYTIMYELDYGDCAYAPMTGTYDTGLRVSAPTKNGYRFTGWTVTSGLNTSTAKYGTTSSSQTTSITSSSQKCLNGTTGDVWFLNLTPNNYSIVTLTANWTPVATARPDLGFVSYAGWPSPVFLSSQNGVLEGSTAFLVGSTIYLYCAFGNIGNADITANYTIKQQVLNASGQEVSSFCFDATSDFWLSSGARMGWGGNVIDFLQGLPVGSYTYKCTLDSSGTIAEGDEANNVFTIPFTIYSAASSYNITYKPGANGTGSQTTDTKTQGVSLTLKGAIFTRTGYTQTGWSTTDGGSKAYNLGASYTSNAALTLYPYWTANTYSVSYALNSGTAGTSAPTSATYDSAFKVSAPSKNGYTFAGWTVTSGLNTSTAKYGTTSSSQTTSITSSSQKCLNGATGDVWFKNLRPTSGSVTLTANWTATDLPNLTPITFQGWSGPLVVSASASNSTNCTATTFAAADNLYVSWAANCSGASISDLFYSDLYVDDVHVTRWHTDEVVVRHSFYIMGYSLGNLSVGTHTIRIVYDSTALVSESDESDNSVTKTITIVDAKPDLCFMQSSGHPAAVYLAKPETPLVPNTTFVQGDGIYLYNRFGNGGEAVISGNYKIVHQVRNQSGTVIGEAVYNCTNDFYKLDVGGYLVWDGPHGIIPQNLGIGTYTYTCTLDTENTISESDETNNAVSIPFEIVAESVLTTYMITFNSNGGTGTMAAQTFTNGVAQALRANAFTRTGYMFAGWATNTTGAVVYTNCASIAPNADMTLYAKWTGNTYTVTLNRQGGSGGTASATATYGNSMPSITKPMRSGYMFGGYYTSTNGDGTQYYTAAGVSARSWNIAGATTLYAKWIPTVPLATALDNAALTFVTGGAANWVGVADESYFGGSSARSGAITHSQSTWMQAQVSDEGTLSFWYKVSSESNWDTLVFYVDGIQKIAASGTGSDWLQFECVVSNNVQHVFEWSYTKDFSVSTGSDCCWIDKVEWMPKGTLPSVAVDADVAAVDAVVDGVGFADEGVKDAIGGSAAEYAAFKEWAGSVKGAGSAGASAAGEAAVVANTNAAAAYLLGAERLFENAPVVEIGEVVVWERTSGTGGSGETGEAGGTAGTGGSEGTGTSISVTVTVKDGEEAVKCAAEKVKAMFEATGDLGDWSGRRVGDNAPYQNALPVLVTVEEGEGATMRFKVVPGDGTESKAFLRIRK